MGCGRGRGASANPKNRFERLEIELDDLPPEDRPSLSTKFYDDASVTAITYNKSPDLPFSASLNPYRGCEHGCAYCYARPTHEYLGFSAGLDFESRIMVKRRAAELLRAELGKRSWKPQVIAMSGVTDAYQPIERKLKLSRACLDVLAECRNPVSIVTKNRLVTRDSDILGPMGQAGQCSVRLSLTSLDSEFARKLEPRTSSPQARLEAIQRLSEAGVPVGVLLAPVIPGLNDHEIPAILSAAREAGANFASYVMIRLPHGLKSLFFDWLEQHYPAKKAKVEERIRSLRGGALNRSDFGERFRGEGIFADQVSQLFQASRRRLGLENNGPTLRVDRFRRPSDGQLEFGI